MCHILYTRRVLSCVPAEANCAICGDRGVTKLFDADFLSRVCDPCGNNVGIVAIELRQAGMVQPDPTLIYSNPL